MGFLLVNSALLNRGNISNSAILYKKTRTSHHISGVISSSERYGFAQRKQSLASLLHRLYTQDPSFPFTRRCSLQYKQHNIPLLGHRFSQTQHLGTFKKCFGAPQSRICVYNQKTASTKSLKVSSETITCLSRW